MTRDVISVTETTSLPISQFCWRRSGSSAFRMFATAFVGIVSRANLVRALAMTVNEPPSGTEADDRTIRDKLLAELKAQRWARSPPT
jgi:hypothetical protein